MIFITVRYLERMSMHSSGRVIFFKEALRNITLPERPLGILPRKLTARNARFQKKCDTYW